MNATVTMNLSTNGSGDGSAVTDADWYRIRSVYFYLMGVVVPLGLLCNALALAVFIRSPQLRRTTPGHFLMALSIADAIYLIGDFIRWLNPSMIDFYMGLNFMHTSSAACKIVMFIRYFGRFASAWITMAIAAQRFLTVVRALEVARISTVRRVRILLLSIGVISLTLNLFPFWTTGKRIYQDRPVCAFLANGTYHTWNTVVLRVGSLLLPACVIFFLTGIIVADLIRVRRFRRTNLNVQGSDMEKKLSGMLVAVALAFLCLRLPYVISYYLNAFKRDIFPNGSALFYFRIYCFYKISDVICTLNYAVNFFLYSLVGSTFRHHFVMMFKRKKQRPLKGRDMTMSSSLKLSMTLNNGTRLSASRYSGINTSRYSGLERIVVEKEQEERLKEQEERFA